MDADTTVTQTGEQANGAGAAPLIEQAKQKTQEVVQLTQQKAGEAMGQAGDQIRTRLDETKTTAADSLGGVAQVIRSSTQHVREKGEELPMGETVAKYAESAADAVEHVAGYLREKNVDEMVVEVEGFARRQPAVFLGSAFALGFLAARFLKSSNPNPVPAGGMQGGQPLMLPPGDSSQTWQRGSLQQDIDMRSGNVSAPTAG